MLSFAKPRECVLNHNSLLLRRELHATFCRRFLDVGQFSGKRNTHRIDGKHYLFDAQTGLFGNLFDRRSSFERPRKRRFCVFNLTIRFFLLASQTASEFRAVKNRPANVVFGKVLKWNAHVEVKSFKGLDQTDNAIRYQVLLICPICRS